MQFDFSDLSPNQRYFLMTQAVIPRPIAWVLSDNGAGEGAGRYNLAPFSFFAGVSADVPLLMISIGRKQDGSKKDTWVNLEERGQATVHIPSYSMMAQMVDSSVESAFGASELLRSDYELIDQVPGFLPRIASAPLAFFAKLHHVHEIPGSQQGILFVEIEQAFVEDEAISTENGRITVDAAKINPVARLGGNEYSLLGSTLKQKRPEK